MRALFLLLSLAALAPSYAQAQVATCHMAKTVSDLLAAENYVENWWYRMNAMRLARGLPIVSISMSEGNRRTLWGMCVANPGMSFDAVAETLFDMARTLSCLGQSVCPR